MSGDVTIALMRKELREVGFNELKQASEVDNVLKNSKGTLLIAVNSVCGCAGRIMRPGVIQSLKHAKKPEALATVFAGQDLDATAKARDYFTGYPPSSPSVALLKDGKVVYMLERKNIEGHSLDQVIKQLTNAYDKWC